ncbi:MAG: DUF1080 domain-containing protein [Bryobacter sp.]|jgi:hypothetical protein|nr:DUF1080 domain-containing protein [Bryobacter sp.]
MNRALLLLILATAAGAAEKGKLLLDEDFRQPAVYTRDFQPAKPGWRVRVWHAEWKATTDGVQSVWTSGHMPVLAFEGAFQDAIIELDFRFKEEPGKKAVCRISAANPELNPRAYSVSSWVNVSSKERALGVVLEHDEWKPGVITTVGNAPAEFAPDQWHTMRLEIVGNQASVSAGGVTVSGSHEKFGLPKTLIAIGAGHSPHEIRRLRVWEAVSRPASQR